MDKLTDLEICKKMAGIEGVTGHEYMGVFVPSEQFNDAVNDSKDNVYGYSVDDYAYNPLTDDALCFKLMVKYRCSVSCVYKMWQCTVKAPSDTALCYDESPNKAICLAIIEAHK